MTAEADIPDDDAHTPESAMTIASAGRYAEALKIVDTALGHSPDDPSWIFARGSTLVEWARFREARPWLLKAIDLRMERPLLFLRAGWTCLWTTGPTSAEPWMRRAAEMVPDEWLGHFGLGMTLNGQGRIDEAFECFQRAATFPGGEQPCLAQLYDCRYRQNRLDEAEAYALRATELDPLNPQNWITLGIARVAQDRFADALEAFERAESVATSGNADPHLNLAICLRETGRLPEALALYERELPHRPSIGAHAFYGHALLVSGRLAEGWGHYEFRWMQEPLLSLRLPLRKPVWAGQDLHGKTILLRCEQGVGDVIQFVRYAPFVKALGATVLLQLRKNITALAKGFPGIDRIVDVGEPLPDFDYYVHLMSLPGLFDTDLESVPAKVPYLLADDSRVADWARRLEMESGFKVGLVWAGDPDHLRDRHRSIALQALASLWDVEGARFYSLQKGAPAEQIAEFAAGRAIVDLGPDLHDFADTAAVLTQLDLLISVDTSVAHLAGALATPVWTLIPTPCDWRWIEGRDDSPWYPTMRLFRQARQGDWPEVIERTRQALMVEIGERRMSSQSQPTAPGISIPLPADEPSTRVRPGLTSVTETRVGILQYWPQHDPVGRSIERYGEFLQTQVETILRWVPQGGTIVEVGAGIGIHSLALASAVGSAGHVMLYEDDSLVRQVLQQNLQANNAGNVTLMKRRLSKSIHVLRDGADTAEQDTETLDDLRLRALDWLKINDEAIAPAVLSGAADTLWRLRPKVWVASQDRARAAVIAAKASDCGYRCFRMETPLFNRDNFNRRPVDVFEGRTFVAILGIPEEFGIEMPLEHCIEL